MYKKLVRLECFYILKHIDEIRVVFPELKDVTYSEISDRLKELNISLYSEEDVKVSNILLRLSLPFAIILIILMLLALPLLFIFTGRWHYSLKSRNLKLYNWFRSLKIP